MKKKLPFFKTLFLFGWPLELKKTYWLQRILYVFHHMSLWWFSCFVWIIFFSSSSSSSLCFQAWRRHLKLFIVFCHCKSQKIFSLFLALILVVVEELVKLLLNISNYWRTKKVAPFPSLSLSAISFWLGAFFKKSKLRAQS